MRFGDDPVTESSALGLRINAWRQLAREVRSGRTMPHGGTEHIDVRVLSFLSLRLINWATQGSANTRIAVVDDSIWHEPIAARLIEMSVKHLVGSALPATPYIIESHGNERGNLHSLFFAYVMASCDFAVYSETPAERSLWHDHDGLLMACADDQAALDEATDIFTEADRRAKSHRSNSA